MPRTQKRWLADQGMPDGVIPLSPSDMFATTGALPLTFSATLGIIGTPTASAANVIEIPLSGLIYRSGMQDDLQETFGAARVQFSASQTNSGKADGAASPPATFSTPAGVTGPPPFAGLTEFTPVTSARPEGLQINSITFNYLITTNAATVNTVRVLDFVYANGVAVAVNTLLASGANGLQTAAAATPYSTVVALTTPAYLTALNHLPVVTWSVSPGAGGVQIYGVMLNCTYNYQ
jgi:hypothetical protein